MNAYLDAASRYPCKCPTDWPNAGWFACTLCLPGDITDAAHAERLAARRRLVRRYSFAIPDDAAVAAIAALSPLVEMGAGTGYWASLLAAAGADIVAYDQRPGRNDYTDHEPYFQVSLGVAADAERHPDRTLFLCWPPMTGMAAKCLAHYRGQRLAYVGEGVGGCCADEAFFAALDREWCEVARQEIPRWQYMRDELYIYERKPCSR